MNADALFRQLSADLQPIALESPWKRAARGIEIPRSVIESSSLDRREAILNGQNRLLFSPDLPPLRDSFGALGHEPKDFQLRTRDSTLQHFFRALFLAAWLMFWVWIGLPKEWALLSFVIIGSIALLFN